MGFLYRLISPSGKVYVGMTKRTMAQRLQSYRDEAARPSVQRPIIRAIRKYGLEAFDVAAAACDDALLGRAERVLIRLHKLVGSAQYNAHEGGTGGATAVSIEATKAKQLQLLGAGEHPFQKPEVRDKQRASASALMRDPVRSAPQRAAFARWRGENEHPNRTPERLARARQVRSLATENPTWTHQRIADEVGWSRRGVSRVLSGERWAGVK